MGDGSVTAFLFVKFGDSQNFKSLKIDKFIKLCHNS